MSFPTVWARPVFDLIPTAQRKDGDLVVDLDPDPKLYVVKNKLLHVAVAQTAQVNVVINDPQGLSGLVGLSLQVTTDGDLKTYTLKYDDSGTPRVVTEATYNVTT